MKKTSILKNNSLLAMLVLSLSLLIVAILINGCGKSKFTGINNLPKDYVNDIVPQDVAKKIAENFDRNSLNKSAGTKSVSRSLPVVESFTLSDSLGQPAIYVFNYIKDSGFILVSADYKQMPVLAFVDNGNLHEGAIPGGMLLWLGTTLENTMLLRLAKDSLHNMVARTMWNRFLNGLSPSTKQSHDAAISYGAGDGIAPLLKTTWGQWCGYNDLCDLGNTYPGNGICYGRPPTGCVATTIAQIVAYWQTQPRYTTYDFASMPPATGNYEVQRLMRDAGIAVDMNYGAKESKASSNKVTKALNEPFGYIFQGVLNNFYTPTGAQAALSNIVSNLNNRQPVILAGCMDRTHIVGNYYTYDNCHMWVCDGFSNLGSFPPGSPDVYMFHMNWGAHETSGESSPNGWFIYDQWKPVLEAPADRRYRYAQEYIFAIHP